MDDLAAKRVYADRTRAEQLVVATRLGVASVALSDGRLGEVGLVHRGSPTDLAVGSTSGTGPRLAVATVEDVLLADEPEVGALAPSRFGPAVAVTITDDGDRVVAVAPDGRLGVHTDEWRTVATLSDTPTSLDGDLVGTTGGVYRLIDGALQPAGLAGVTDVARAGGVPLAATGDGLYVLGNGWMDVLAGDVRVVADASDGRAHAATGDTLFELVDGEWRPVDIPSADPIGAIAYGEFTYVLTEGGDLLVETSGGWDAHALGLDGVCAAGTL